MAKPKISITTPSFNQGAFILETLRSITDQNYENVEHTIFDGGSSDQTVKIIKENSDNIEFWKSEPDGGQSHAINKGFERATGEIFNWLNSDDLLAPGALQIIASGFENPKTNIFIGRSVIFSEKGEERISRGTDIYDDSLAKTLGRARIDQPEHWWRKNILDEIGPLNENLNYTMDRDWWVKYLLRFGMEGIVKSDEIIAHFRLHEASKTVSKSNAFDEERNAYYRSLAIQYGLVEHAKNLYKFNKSATIPLTNMPQKVNLEMLNEAFQHFYALLCEEAYAIGNHKLALQLIPYIQKDVLNDLDQSIIERIKFRGRIPSILIRTAKKITGRK